jgi:hypothetical protein
MRESQPHAKIVYLWRLTKPFATLEWKIRPSLLNVAPRQVNGNNLYWILIDALVIHTAVSGGMGKTFVRAPGMRELKDRHSMHSSQLVTTLLGLTRLWT